jgi:hypothetical protein
MPKLSLSLNFPLRVRGIKGVISIISIIPLAPLILKRGIFGRIDEIRLLRWQNHLVLWILVI